ncbi:MULTISPECIES: hypothetical protein [Pasteurellaceae]|uniref:hypothetical protein n=1 Tax=Pasteurellaceae TaxID=712 RepID=UPI003566DA82
MNYFITLGITTLAIGSALQAYAETEQLEQINVEGKAGTSSGETAKKNLHPSESGQREGRSLSIHPKSGQRGPQHAGRLYPAG